MSGVTPCRRDEKGAPRRRFARRKQKVAPQRVGAGETLDRFEDDCRGGGIDRLLQHAEVAARDELDIERLGGKAVPALGTPGDRGCGSRAAVKGPFDRHHLRPSGLAEREAQRVLVRFGAAVDQERLLESFRCEADQRLGGAPAHQVRHRVRLELQLPGLMRQRREQPRMAVAEERHRMTAVEVEDPPALPGFEPDILTADRLDRQVLVDRQEIARLELGGRGLRAGFDSGQWTGDHFVSSH
jgi:hypothetical protein